MMNAFIATAPGRYMPSLSRLTTRTCNVHTRVHPCHAKKGKTRRNVHIIRLSQNVVNNNDKRLSDDLQVPRYCFVDMDGTILTSKNTIHPRNVEAVMRLLKNTDVGFIPATGKSRTGALRAMAELGMYLREAYPGGVCGVFLQGLCVYGADGSLLYERTLDADVSKQVVALADELETSLIAYGVDGDTILCETEDDETAKLEAYYEPSPTPIGSWNSVIGQESIHKFIFMAPEERILEIRPSVEARLGGVAAITRATPGMLEVLPYGASKGDGVARLLTSLSTRPEDVLAIGDGENDVEMLRLCRISVAMDNAVPAAKAVAKYRTLSNDEAGVADAIQRFVFNRSLTKDFANQEAKI